MKTLSLNKRQSVNFEKVKTNPGIKTASPEVSSYSGLRLPHAIVYHNEKRENSGDT